MTLRRRNHSRGGSKTRPVRVLTGLLLLAAACSPPRPAATITPAITAIPDVGYPLTPPDVALGAQIFARRCIACHGDQGLADGPLVRAEAIPAPPKLAEWETGFSKTPAERFAFITVGNMDQMMPPWNEALSEPERWAVTLFTYTLHTTPQQLEQGRALWDEQCAACHGESGQPTAAQVTTDLSDVRQKITMSDETIYNSITQGLADGTHIFNQLDDDQRRAIVTYTRSLSVANSDAIGQPILSEPTAEATAP